MAFIGYDDQEEKLEMVETAEKNGKYLIHSHVNFICFYIISFHVVIFHKFKRMCSYHLKAIILAEAKMTIKVFHPYIACHLCKVPRLMAESRVAKESRLIYIL